MTTETSPRRVDIYLTHRCNLACPFCYYKSRSRSFLGESDERDLSLHDWLAFLERLCELKTLAVGIFGGEALLYPGIWEIIDWFSRHPMRFSLLSNGTTLTDEAVSRLKASRRCDYVQISIDGSEAHHDAIRGQGVYQKAIAALRRLKDAGIPVHVNMVLTPGSIDDIAAEALHLLDDVKVDSLRINPLSGTIDGKRLEEPEIAKAIRTLLPIHNSHPDTFRLRGVLKYLAVLRHPFEPSEAHPCTSCDGLLGIRCAILADGSVIPCMDAETVILGNVIRDDFYELWHSEKWLRLHERVRQPRELPRPECESCRFAGNCRTNCLSHAALCAERICYRLLAEQLGDLL